MYRLVSGHDVDRGELSRPWRGFSRWWKRWASVRRQGVQRDLGFSPGVLGVFIILFATNAFAQQSAPPPAFQAPRGAYFALSVKNLETTAGWYKQKLGFREVKQGASRDGASRSIILDREGVVLELIHHKQASSGTTLRKDYKPYLVFGVFKIGLIVDDADHTMQRLQANGVQIANGPWTDQELQMRSFFIRDNEGNIIQFLSKVSG